MNNFIIILLIIKTNLDDLTDSEESLDITKNKYWCEWCNCIDCEANNYYNTLIWNNNCSFITQ